jgi:hypothetical protein
MASHVTDHGDCGPTAMRPQSLQSLGGRRLYISRIVFLVICCNVVCALDLKSFWIGLAYEKLGIRPLLIDK